jgi:predicted MPP superfamily phosphohydrolase
MKWLHLSDLHVGRVNESYQTTALRSLVSAIAEAVADQRLDAVFLTGDLTNAGKPEEYEQFARLILAPLRTLPAFNDAIFYSAPGNHDLDCDLSLPPSWEHLGAGRQKIFFEETLDAARLRSQRAESFRAYSNFVASHSIFSVDPLSNISRAFEHRTNDTPCHIISTNTSFFCDKELQDRERIPPPDGSLRSILPSLGTEHRVIILGHHPVHWFLPNARSPFKSMLLQHRALYLHGHTHEIEVQFGATGVESFGFGAAYQAPQNAPPRAYYRNSFALCCVNEQLHVAPYHWDQENGRWVATTTLPPGFVQRSLLIGNAWAFDLARSAAGKILGMLPVSPLRGPVVRLTPAASLTAADWSSFVVYSGILAGDVTEEKLTPKASQPGTFSFEYKLPAGLHFVRCISSPGSHLSRAEIEDINTRLDTEGYASYTVISLGTMSDDAETTYLRLRIRKAISVHTARQLAERLSSMGAFSGHLRSLDGAVFDNEFALSSGGRPILLVHDKVRAARFYVLDDHGHILPEDDARVVALRKARPDLARAEYRGSDKGESDAGNRAAAFDRSKYLQSCHAEFLAVKYAPLATLGLRFHGVTLDELYVETGAQVGAEGASGEAISKALDDLMQGAQIDESLRRELTDAVTRTSRGQAGQEYGSARVLYQQFGSVAVLGDPGSGKSCFVKREVLAYCNPVPGSWYEHHTPLYVPLAEVAREIGNAEPNVLAVGALLASRRGCAVDEDTLENLFAMGLLALFFDGLDEVVSVEVRSVILASIKRLVDRGKALGNRFVITSRPAAIHRVELPKGLDVLRMQGLTDTEMRLLAERILAARISETRGEVRLDLQHLTSVDQSIIEQLLSDCRRVAGIDRLARNPLFLTLLVMIYANSGAASARRHRVYQQAISTLVSIRAREAGQRGLAESDLRSRLGNVALAVFRDPKGALPSLARVLQQVTEVVQKEREEAVSRVEIERYLQDVAEATGLLIMNREGAEDTNPTVTFMHHSFLEYYAAIGLANSEPLGLMSEIARIPRWRDIITLFAGIVADTGGLGPLIDTLLRSTDPTEAITLESTLLAFDCALEAEVAPERVVRALLTQTQKALSSGPLLHDAGLRSEIGTRLGKLISASGSPLFERFFLDGLLIADDDVSAAYIDLLGHSAIEAIPSHAIVAEYDRLCRRAEGLQRRAICAAAARSLSLRSLDAMTVVGAALSGGAATRRASLQAIMAAPSLGIASAEALAAGVDDTQREIAELSARALLRVGLSVEEANPARVSVLTTSIRRIAESASLNVAADLALSYTRQEVENLLGSSERGSKLLGIRMLAWIRGDEHYVHEQLMRFVDSPDREECVAALGSLRISASAQKLVTVPDAYVLRKILKKGDTRDVRLAAARVLGTFLYADEDVAREILSYCKGVRDTPQYQYAVRVVGWSADMQEISEAFLLDECGRLLSARNIMSPNRVRDLKAVLGELEQLDSEGAQSLKHGLEALTGSFRVEASLRQAALLAMVAVTPVDEAIVFLSGILESSPAHLESAPAQAAARFSSRCRKRLEHVRMVYPHLADFERALIAYHEKTAGMTGSVQDSATSALREALVDVRYMFNSYREFAQRLSHPPSSAG